jgi:four helix bundle protein
LAEGPRLRSGRLQNDRRISEGGNYGLTSRLRRAAVSIAANIGEGFAKRGKADKARFMNTAEGSLEETRYYLILSQDLSYGNTGELMELLNEVGRLLKGYSRAILVSHV